MIKNLTLFQIIVFLSFALGGIQISILLALYFSGFLSPESILFCLVLSIIFLLISFLLIRYLIQVYVSIRIRQVYNLIKLLPLGKIANAHLELSSIDDLNNEIKKWAQEKKKEVSKLNQIEEYSSNFLGNISHELKTPIFSIQGYLHTLADGGIYDEMINLKYLNRAIANLDRLELIVEDLDTISNLKSQMQKIEFEEFDIKKLTIEVAEDLDFMAKKRNISLLFQNSKPFLVFANEELIRQVLDNLISNSIKYGRKSGTTQLGFVDMIDHVLVKVTDDGVGIAEKHIKKLFDRFYRVDTGRGRKQGGSGLGLSIVKHIIEAHDENISVNSNLGAGSTFAFTLKKADKRNK